MYVVSSSLQTDCPIMLINSHIGYDGDVGMGVDGAAFQRELLNLENQGFKSIQVCINSPGGVVMDGYNIYNAILNSKIPVDTYCSGMAASIAAVIFQAGRKRVMADYSRLMFHNPFGSDDKKAMNAITGSIVTMIASRSGKPEADVAMMMDKTSWILPEEAIADGLCTAIDLSNTKNVPRGVSTKAFYQSAQLITNSILNISNKTESMNLSKITNILNLNPEASEDAVVREINTINNKAAKAEQDKVKAENDLKIVKDQLEQEKSNHTKDVADKEVAHTKAIEAKDDEIKNLKDSYKKKIAEAEQIKKEKEENEGKVHLEKCKNMVTGYAKQGRIKNEESEINDWVKLAVDNYEVIENRLKALPINAKASSIQTVNDSADKPSNPAAYLTHKMATIQASTTRK